MTIIGNIVIAIAFIFLGPLPILEVETQLSLIQGMVAVVGLGYGMIVTSSFCRAQATALQLGYDDNIITVDRKDRVVDSIIPLIPFNHKPNNSKFRELTSDFILFSKILFEPNFCSVKLKQIFSLEQTLLSVKRNLRSMKQQPSHTSDHVSAS